ncbi:hypothetical protein I5J32_04410 [Pseudomonas aeruginosa]|nr:hypothetical protein [Pseudomonas aeruginosa]
MVGGDFNWAVVVSVIVGIVGWIFVYHNSRSLARQSEANAIVAAIEKMLQEIVSDVSDFWGRCEDDNTDLAARLFACSVDLKCNFVEHKVSLLERKCRKLTHWAAEPKIMNFAVEKIADLRDSATLDSEISNKMPEADRERRIVVVNSKAIDLYMRLSDSVTDRYKSMVDLTYETFEGRNP